MKVTASSKNLFQLTRLVAFNCYLIREDDGFTLIDTNMSGQAQAIVQEASKLGLPIVRILLTHAHVDHVGSLDALHDALPNVQVAISERDARFLSGDKSLDPSEPQVRLRGGYPVCKTKPALLLHEGDHIGSLEVIATPGHTPGHIAFLDTRHKGLALESARKLLALQPSLLAVGHGRVVSNPQPAMERAIHVMERSLANEEGKKPHVA